MTLSTRVCARTNSRASSELWSFSLAYDLRVVFHFLPQNRAVFENIGSHDEVY
jgi:mRNA-degrading endonuclease YafQ of YafQ-DinJ toxin-antitoxin module